jgi:hypothetical protein
LRMATYFTTSPRNISRRFGNGHHETLFLTQPREPSNKRGQSCQPRRPIPAFTLRKFQAAFAGAARCKIS